MATEPSDGAPSRPTLKRLQLSGTAAFMVTAVLVGVLTGGASIGFVWLIRVLERWFDGIRTSLMNVAPLLTVLIPALGGLGAGLLITYVAEEIRYGGISDVLQAIAMQGSRLRERAIWAKLLATALCIGTGGQMTLVITYETEDERSRLNAMRIFEVPEPATLTLLGLGVLPAIRRRRTSA